jgi:hypothetical protein
MSIHTRGPFSCGGGPIGHSAPKAGEAAIAAPADRTARRLIRLRKAEARPVIASSPVQVTSRSLNETSTCCNTATGRSRTRARGLRAARRCRSALKPAALTIGLALSSYRSRSRCRTSSPRRPSSSVRVRAEDNRDRPLRPALPRGIELAALRRASIVASLRASLLREPLSC